MPALLEVRNLVKSYPGVVAVNDVSFSMERGEVVALLGENGAGKSTLSKMISGVERPDSGSIFLEGVKMHFGSATDAIARGISMVHQELSMVGEMSIAENIFMNRQPVDGIGCVKWKQLYADTSALLKSFRLELDPRTLVKRLPVGTQQLLEILRATTMQSRLIILDEPTSSLAESQIRLMFDNIRRLKGEGYGFIYITHKLDEVREIADRIIVLRDGCIAGERRTQDIELGEIVTMMVGREIKQLFGEESRGRQISPEYLFEVEGLCAEHLYHDVSFGVRRGEIVGVAGLIGAGRTEMALGIIHAHKRTGKVRLGGRELRIENPADAIHNGIAYITEDRKQLGLYLDYSIGRNLTVMQLKNFSNKLGMLKKARMDGFAEEQVREFRIMTPSVGQKLGHLSGGNQQKCLLSMWMGIHPEVFIVDEPTRGIDVGAKSEVYQMLKKLADDGRAVLVISSELPELLGICDRIIVMRGGTVAGEVMKADFSEKTVMGIAMCVDKT